MLAARQMRRQNVLLADWPPTNFLKTRAVTHLHPKPFTQQEVMSGLQELQNDLVNWRPHIVSHPSHSDAQPSAEAKLLQHMQLIHSLKVDLAGTMDLDAAHRYPSIRFLEALMGSWMLRSGHDLKNMARHIITICVPSYLQATMLKRIEQPRVIPSRSSITYGRIALDLSFSMAMREVFSPPGGASSPIWWLWADSSPMGGSREQVGQHHG